jgi:hypothetical protein
MSLIEIPVFAFGGASLISALALIYHSFKNVQPMRNLTTHSSYLVFFYFLLETRLLTPVVRSKFPSWEADELRVKLTASE